MQYSQTILGKIPSKSNCYKIITINGHASLCKQPALRKYESQFFLQNKLRGLKITGYFNLTVDVFYENMRPDLDNCFKVLLDCLQSSKTIINDRQCVMIHARKLIDKTNPRIEFQLEEVTL